MIRAFLMVKDVSKRQPRTKPGPTPVTPHRVESKQAVDYLAHYFWFIFKNVLGWILILGALPVGITLPGPGGLPLFIIGFAMVTFPGKRKLTSRVMRGKRLHTELAIFGFITAAFSVLLTAGVLWYLHDQFEHFKKFFDRYSMSEPAGYIAVGLTAFIATWVASQLGLRVLNFVIQKMPWMRRKIRPVLKRMGINFLPSRRKRETDIAGGTSVTVQQDEILELSPSAQSKLNATWNFVRPWLRRMVALGITIGLFVLVVSPIKDNWQKVLTQLNAISPMRFFLASGMFTLFLGFRAISWRRILIGFKHYLPIGATLRIWSTSELARYLPGAIWQVIGRVFLVRPYGVSGSICSTSQVLELSTFLLANVMVAAACLLKYAAKMSPEARPWMYAAMTLVPVLGFLLHPRIFYGVTNAVLSRLRKPVITDRLSGYALMRMLGRMILALVWQSTAVFILLQPVLELKWDWWWTVAGAYCLAWSAGFLAVWAPGGVGVRELVFVAAMGIVLPPSVLERFGDSRGLLGALAIILRVWATIGELTLCAIAYTVDWAGATGHHPPVEPARRTVVQ